MPHWIVKPASGLIEPMLAPEYVVDGIGAVENRDGRLRIYLYTEQLTLDDYPDTHRVVVAKMVIRRHVAALLFSTFAACLSTDCTDQVIDACKSAVGWTQMAAVK